jgi:hypothetical protein
VDPYRLVEAATALALDHTHTTVTTHLQCAAPHDEQPPRFS